MPIRRPSQVTKADAVLSAIIECDKLGREAFREQYGYGPARSYFLRHEGKTYDSKAIIGVAYGYQHKTEPLQSDEFSGGAVRVKPVLERLGFAVVTSDLPNEKPPYLSDLLDIGEVYTREQLREQFEISDATIKNGVFRPAGSKSIWLFVTREKTADRPQLVDKLDGDVLEWDGQPKGRTDQMLIDHIANGDEVLLFYREHRNQYAGGGFVYEGVFVYRSHSGSQPTAFIFDREQSPGEETAGDGDAFDPTGTADGRDKILGFLRRRIGQGKFRRDLVKAYNGTCCITGCNVLPLLEAAHIYPYKGKETNHVTNGLLLRADIHSLFDLGLIGVRSDGTIDVCSSLKATEYAALSSLALPKNKSHVPSAKALEWHLTHVASPEARGAALKRLGLI